MPKCNKKSPKATNLDYICHQVTGRWVKKSSSIGKKIIGASLSPAKVASPSPSPSPSSPSPGPVDERLTKACKGKGNSSGGMNLPELLKIANSKGYTGKNNRKDVQNFVCQSSIGVSAALSLSGLPLKSNDPAPAPISYAPIRGYETVYQYGTTFQGRGPPPRGYSKQGYALNPDRKSVV